MKVVNVVCAIFIEDNKVFMCQRPKGKSLENYYEFPGGKIEDGETPENALIREIYEELDAVIEVGNCFTTVNYDYVSMVNCTDFTLCMKAYLCKLKSEFTLKEHQNYIWCTNKDLDKLLIPPADKEIIDKLKTILK